MGTRVRFPEPPNSLDTTLRNYLSELIRELEDFDTRIFSQETGVLFETSRKRPYTEVSSNHTMGQYQSVLLVDASAGDVLVSVPLALDFKGTFMDIKRIDTNASYVVSIEGSGGDMPVVLQGSGRPSVTLFSDGSNVWII